MKTEPASNNPEASPTLDGWAEDGPLCEYSEAKGYAAGYAAALADVVSWLRDAAKRRNDEHVAGYWRGAAYELESGEWLKGKT